jgi:CRISPR-associated protein Cas2
VAGDRRRTRLAKVLKDLGARVQLSVYECQLDLGQLDLMTRRLSLMIDQTKDSVRIYRVCDACLSKIVDPGNWHGDRRSGRLCGLSIAAMSRASIMPTRSRQFGTQVTARAISCARPMAYSAARKVQFARWEAQPKPNLGGNGRGPLNPLIERSLENQQSEKT